MPRAALALLSLRVSCAAFPEIAVDQFPDGMGRKGPPVPLTFVSGFLGSGKTTMLKHVLENKEGRRVGVVVNDVAEVNIDAKLLARAQMADEDNEYEDTVELENDDRAAPRRSQIQAYISNAPPRFTSVAPESVVKNMWLSLPW